MSYSQQSPMPIQENVLEKVAANKKIPTGISLETLVLLVNTERLKSVHNKTETEFKELKTRQEHVSKLHKLLKKINAETTSTGEFDCTSHAEIKKLISEAKDLGVDLKTDKLKYNKDERDRLVENIRMTIDDFNVKNDMQLQAVNRLTNERYESYQLARAILKPLHEAKMQSARGFKS
jgi:hypothetical protein